MVAKSRAMLLMHYEAVQGRCEASARMVEAPPALISIAHDYCKEDT